MTLVKLEVVADVGVEGVWCRRDCIFLPQRQGMQVCINGTCRTQNLCMESVRTAEL